MRDLNDEDLATNGVSADLPPAYASALGHRPRHNQHRDRRSHRVRRARRPGTPLPMLSITRPYLAPIWPMTRPYLAPIWPLSGPYLAPI